MIGSGANKSDVEAIDMLEKDNHKIMLETYKIIEEILHKQRMPMLIIDKNPRLTNKSIFNANFVSFWGRKSLSFASNIDFNIFI